MDTSTYILHLTDLHISTQEESKTIWDKWNRLLTMLGEKVKVNISFVVITGDLTANGEEKEFETLILLLEELLKVCQLSNNQVIFCPGNHDADTSKEESTFFHYEQFLSHFYGQPMNNQYQRLIESKEKNGVEVISINTNTKTSLKDPDKGYFTFCGQPTDTEAIRILAMHHPLESIQNTKDMMALIDQMDLVLGGHLHPSTPRIQVLARGLSLIGIAYTPHLSSIPKGGQLVCISKNKNVKVENLIL